MAFRKFAGFLLLTALLVSSATAQTKDDAAAAKDKQLRELYQELLERTISEIGGLRLARNRAVVYALAGDACWASDSKRAREMFRSGANELMSYQAETERERLAAINPEPPEPVDARYEFLNLVGARDPELGLEIMQQTRTPAVAEAMVRVAQQRESGSLFTSGFAVAVGAGIGSGTSAGGPPITATQAMDNVRASQEISLEEQFKLRIAMSDPDKSAKAIRDSLAKGISPTVLPMLQQVMQKDEKLANDLGGEIVGKLNGTDLSKSQSDLSGALSIVQTMGRPAPTIPANAKYKYFAFTTAQAKESAYAVANTFLQPAPPAFVTAQMSRAIPIVEALAPEKALLMKQRDAQNKKSAAAAPGTKPGTAPATRSWDPNGTPEEIMAAAGKLSNPRDKTAAYQAAANRIATVTDETRARRLAESIPDERIRAMAIERLDTMRLSKLSSEGNLEEARRQVAAMPNARAKLRWLVNLAVQFKGKNTEKDGETANALMAEARTFTNAYPEDEDELGDYMELVRGFATVDTDTAFRMFEPMVTEFNDMIQASATLSKFNKRDRSFQKGEMVMRIGGPGSLLPFRYVSQLQALARSDFERTNVLVDRFRRSDARLLMRLYVLQGWQRRPMPPAPRPPASSTTTVNRTLS